VGRRAATLAALAALPGIGPRRLRLLLAHHDPEQAWAVVRRESRAAPMVAAMLAERGLGAQVAHHATDALLATMRAPSAHADARHLHR
jgi:nitrogen regulatory protein PII-like uncharacterized protein